MKQTFFLCLALMVVSAGRADNLTISSVGKLQEFQQQVNDGDDFSGCTVTLTSDLDLEGIDWIPIGTTGKPFRGTFDGQGHWISNIKVNIDGAQTGDVAGLFGCIDEGAIVMRIGIQSGEIRISQKSHPLDDVECYMGGIVGRCKGAISECANQATVYGNLTCARVGGIAGEITESGIVEDCYNLGRLYTSKSYEDSNYLGGIAGVCDDGTICRVYVSASIESGSTVNTDGIVPMLGFEKEPEAAFYDDGETEMLGFALDGKLNTEGNYSVWSFAEGRLPLLTCLSEQTQPTAGDVNDDGQVNVSDVTALVTIILGGDDSEPHIYNHKAADVNADNAVNVSDVTALVTIILGLN